MRRVLTSHIIPDDGWYSKFSLDHSTSIVLGKHAFNNSYKRVVVLGMFCVGWNLYNILKHASTSFYIEYSEVIKHVANSFSKSGHDHQLFLLICGRDFYISYPFYRFKPFFFAWEVPFFSQVCKTDSEASFPLGAVLRAVQKQLTTLETQVQSLGWIWMDGWMASLKKSWPKVYWFCVIRGKVSWQLEGFV